MPAWPPTAAAFQPAVSSVPFGLIRMIAHGFTARAQPGSVLFGALRRASTMILPSVWIRTP